MKKPDRSYEPETIGSVMSTNIPTCMKQDSYRSIVKSISNKSWDSVDVVYVVDANDKLLGFVNLAKVVQTDHEKTVSDIMEPVAGSLAPEADQEEAVFLAIEKDLPSLPVTDHSGRFLGAVGARKIIDIMHEEHLEDAILTAGIRGKGSGIVKLFTERLRLVVRARVLWLIVGLFVGLGLGYIASYFEETLQETVAIAYFIPVVAYIADSVGTQSEAIAVRTLAMLKVNYFRYLLRELVVGLMIGAIVGVLGGLGAVLIAGSADIGLVVGLSLWVASTIAAVLAVLIPITFKFFGKDPALGSGPLATALQDVVSILIYFLFAVALIK